MTSTFYHQQRQQGRTVPGIRVRAIAFIAHNVNLFVI